MSNKKGHCVHCEGAGHCSWADLPGFRLNHHYEKSSDLVRVKWVDGACPHCKSPDTEALETERDALQDEIDQAWAALGIHAKGKSLAAVITGLIRDHDKSLDRLGHHITRANRAESALMAVRLRIEAWEAKDD